MRRPSREQVRMREQVRHHAVLPRNLGQALLLPDAPCALEVLRELQVMDPREHIVGLWLGAPRTRAPLLERGPDPLSAFGQLRARRPDSDPDLSPGSCRRCRSLHTTGIASPTAASLSAEPVGPFGADAGGDLVRAHACAVERQVHTVELLQRHGQGLCLLEEVLEPRPVRGLARKDALPEQGDGASSRTSRCSSAPTAPSSSARCSPDSTTSPKISRSCPARRCACQAAASSAVRSSFVGYG